jgi:hypothetical protein
MRVRSAVLAVLLLSGCTAPRATTPAVPATSTPRPSAAAPSAPGGWREPARYTFVLQRTCGEGPLSGLFRITVVDGTVADAVALDETGRQELRDGARDYLPTLGQLVRKVTDVRAKGAAVAQLVVDPVDGHPTRIEIDPERNAIDDELCFTLSGYRAG